MNVRSSTIPLILFALVVRGETPTPPPAANALDAARRDLRALPATEKARDGLGKLPGSASVPTLTIPNSGDAPQNKPDETTSPSPTWLLDALSKTDTERSQRRLSPDATSGRPLTDGSSQIQAQNPLAQYLGQWMAPRDLELLRPGLKNTADQATTRPEGSLSPATDQAGLTGMQSVSSSQRLFGEPAKNPYLQEVEPVPLPANSFAMVNPANTPGTERSRVPQSLPAIPSNDLPTKQDLRKPAATAVEPAVVSPAAPIINSGKYFPQLRRF